MAHICRFRADVGRFESALDFMCAADLRPFMRDTHALALLQFSAEFFLMSCCVDESILDVVLMGGDQLAEQLEAA